MSTQLYHKMSRESLEFGFEDSKLKATDSGKDLRDQVCLPEKAARVCTAHNSYYLLKNHPENIIFPL